MKRLFKDAVELRAKRETLDEPDYDSAVLRLEGRALGLAGEAWESDDARRLAARIQKHAHELFTFLWHDGVDPTNNLTEREVRTAVQDRRFKWVRGYVFGAPLPD